jgi:hypothetical protein
MKWQKGAAASILTLAASGIAFAGDIYKWVDEDGHVHYGDKPVGAQSERMAIQSTPTDPARIAAQAQALATARMEAREAEATAAAEEPSEEAHGERTSPVSRRRLRGADLSRRGRDAGGSRTR